MNALAGSSDLVDCAVDPDVVIKWNIRDKNVARLFAKHLLIFAGNVLRTHLPKFLGANVLVRIARLKIYLDFCGDQL